MRRDWFSFRILPTRTAVVGELVDHLHAADPAARWLFRRPAGVAWLELSFHTVAGVGRELERRVRHAGGDLGTVEPPAGRAAGIDHAASEFALALLRRGEPEPDATLPVTVCHLARVLSLVPESAHADFLFLCWQRRIRPLGATQRVDLGIAADRMATTLAERLDGVRPDHVWQRYARALRRILVEQPPTDLVPVNYLLFEHVHLTHDRLDIPVVVQALAVRALRTALTTGAIVSVDALLKGTETWPPHESTSTSATVPIRSTSDPVPVTGWPALSRNSVRDGPP